MKVGVMFNSEDGSLVLCGAKSKRNAGRPCEQPAMRNGRCRLHGGFCRGPKTREGKRNVKITRTKHGFYSIESIMERRFVRNLIKSSIQI
jgi:hypothetical protein